MSWHPQVGWAFTPGEPASACVLLEQEGPPPKEPPQPGHLYLAAMSPAQAFAVAAELVAHAQAALRHQEEP